MKNNNKGFSLVELLVVIAILGIVTTSASMGFSVLYSANVNNSAGTIDSILSKVRMNNMSKVQTQYLQVYKVNGVNYYRIHTSPQIDFSYKLHKLGSSNIGISYTLDNRSYRITDNNGIVISFSRSGSCEVYRKNGVKYGSEEMKGLTFFNGSKDKSVRIISSVGKHYLK